MDKQTIVNQAVKKYHRLDKVLRNRMLKDEHASFLRGRQLELMLLIYSLDEQASARLTGSPSDAKITLTQKW